MYQESTVGQMISSENDAYDSGVPTDSKLRTPERKCSPQKECVLDYDTGSSSPDEVPPRERSSGDDKSQDTLIDYSPGVAETSRSEEPTSKESEEEPHTVTCTVTISFAIPAPPKPGTRNYLLNEIKGLKTLKTPQFEILSNDQWNMIM